MKTVDLVVPDLGDFKDVPVVDVLVKAGDRVKVEDSLITLETDKASMDVPATSAGVVEQVLVKKGERVSKGTAIVKLRVEDKGEDESDRPYVDTIVEVAPAEGVPQPFTDTIVEIAPEGATPAFTDTIVELSPPPAAEQPYIDTIALDAEGEGVKTPSRQAKEPPTQAPARSVTSPSRTKPTEGGNGKTQLVVLGAGPGGYTAAFRAADLGMRVTLIERDATLGGVCLNVGCIPSKALLHAARVIEDAESMAPFGIAFGDPKIDREKLRGWKNRVVGRLTNGLSVLAKQRKVEVVKGVAKFLGPHHIEVRSGDQVRKIEFDHCIIAAGSEPARLPKLPDDPRIIDSTGALELPEGVARLLVVGGGIIGLEMACVYDALGSKVSVVELTEQLMPGTDPDLVRPLEKRIGKRYEQIMLGTRVEQVEVVPNGIRVSFADAKAPAAQVYDAVLVAVGRTPNGRAIGAEAAGVKVDERGYIAADRQQRTNVPHIFAIGDVIGAPMLAHKAAHQGKVAAEVASGLKRSFDARVIPSVAYTDPEIAWAGLTETEAKQRGIEVGKGAFPWVANARSLTLNRDEGFTKILFDKATHRALGAGIVGINAGDLIAEMALAIEMGADAADIGLTVHPHPTLSETIAFAAEAFDGTLTDLYIPKK
jgi:dihydrolipoamide dehydrogenase